MTDVESLLDELNGRLTSVTVRYPDAEPYIESLRKHIRFALHNPEKARLGKLLKKSRTWLNEQSWKHPIFRADFMKMVELIDKFEKRGE
jgi:hypothetical protein